MLPGLIQITNDFGLECCIGEGKSKNNITGSTKGNFPLPIFQGEPTRKSTSTPITIHLDIDTGLRITRGKRG